MGAMLANIGSILAPVLAMWQGRLATTWKGCLWDVMRPHASLSCGASVPEIRSETARASFASRKGMPGQTTQGHQPTRPRRTRLLASRRPDPLALSTRRHEGQASARARRSRCSFPPARAMCCRGGQAAEPRCSATKTLQARDPTDMSTRRPSGLACGSRRAATSQPGADSGIYGDVRESRTGVRRTSPCELAQNSGMWPKVSACELVTYAPRKMFIIAQGIGSR